MISGGFLGGSWVGRSGGMSPLIWVIIFCYPAYNQGSHDTGA